MSTRNENPTNFSRGSVKVQYCWKCGEMTEIDEYRQMCSQCGTRIFMGENDG